MILSNKTYYTGQEGCARNSNKDNIRFLNISAGSLAELDTQLIISKELEYITQEKLLTLEPELERIGQLLHGLIRHIREKDEK
ncbi:MAG: four helix bundle protein [Saprospiraceae bacterium]|nr:four helix bundle protein [Saprospiraceae bacterium]